MAKQFYCFCDDDCKFPTMTMEQIIAAIAEATGNTPTNINDAVISKIKEANGKNLTFWHGTEAEFNALGVAAPQSIFRIDENGKIYITGENTLEVAGKVANPLTINGVDFDGSVPVGFSFPEITPNLSYHFGDFKICVKRQEIEDTVSTAWGNVYRTANLHATGEPSLDFTNTPVMFLSVRPQDSSLPIWLSTSWGSAKKTNFYICAAEKSETKKTFLVDTVWIGV